MSRVDPNQGQCPLKKVRAHTTGPLEESSTISFSHLLTLYCQFNGAAVSRSAAPQLTMR